MLSESFNFFKLVSWSFRKAAEEEIYHIKESVLEFFPLENLLSYHLDLSSLVFLIRIHYWIFKFHLFPSIFLVQLWQNDIFSSALPSLLIGRIENFNIRRLWKILHFINPLEVFLILVFLLPQASQLLSFSFFNLVDLLQKGGRKEVFLENIG